MISQDPLQDLETALRREERAGGPLDASVRHHIIWFADTDEPPIIVTDEKIAEKVFVAKQSSWTVSLFRQVMADDIAKRREEAAGKPRLFTRWPNWTHDTWFLFWMLIVHLLASVPVMLILTPYAIRWLER